MPSWFACGQSAATSPASTSRVTSGSRENATTSAGSPASTARLCSPDDAYDCSNSTSFPGDVFWNAGISSS